MRRRPQRLPRPPAVIEPRIPEITKKYGGRAASVPQGFYDFITADGNNPNTHPHMGPFTHKAVRSGLWSDPATWDTGTVPGNGASVNVGGYTVTYDVESDAKITDIHVGTLGKIRWATNKDTRLWIDTLMCHGTFIMGEAGDPIGESTTLGKPRAEMIFHQVIAPGATTRLGLNTMGPMRYLGAEKSDRLFGKTDLLAGQTRFRLERLSAANWRKGDKIVFVATEAAGLSPSDPQYTGPTQFYGPFLGFTGVQTRTLGYRQSQDEVRTIVAINGDTLTIDTPLAYNHLTYADTLPRGQYVKLKPPVALLSRSILFRSADPTVRQKRGHTMFMHHDDIDGRGAEFRDLGRTDTNPSLVQPDGTLAYASNGGAVITDANNVRGRYPIHIHWTGPFFGRKSVNIKNNSVWGVDIPIPGWGIVHHGSRASIDNNVVYNVRGGGIVSELGNEIGQWMNNTVAWCRGDGFDMSWGSRAEKWQNHNGHAGVAYESQSRNILQQGNIASSSSFAWSFMQQDVDQLARIPDKYSLRLYDSITQGAGTLSGVFNQDEDTYGIEQAQIPDFDDNYAYGCGSLFFVAHRQFLDRTDNTPMLSKRCHAINCGKVFNLINYSFNYGFYDALWIGTNSNSAASLGNVSWAINFGNIKVKNFPVGFLQNGGGFNYGGYWMDIAFENVPTPFTNFTANWDITGWQAANPGKTFPQDHALYNLMGPWVTTASTPGVSWSGILREWKNYTIGDLPDAYPAAPRGLGGAEPLPGTPKPYFILNPSSVTNLSGKNSVSLTGVIVDTVGVRRWPDWYSSESFSPTSTSTPPIKRNENATPEDLVLRNGCFQVAGVWKTRCWMADYDRWNGNYLQFYIDLTVSNVEEAVLLANVVDPVAPALPLIAEATGEMQPIDYSTAAPVINVNSFYSVEENRTLAITLRANDGSMSWSLTGGTDKAQFEIAVVNGLYTLRWAADGTKDYELPNDADANNSYAVQVTATNRFGISALKSITVTVRDKNEAVVSSFADDFNRPDELIEMSPNWLRVDGEEGQAVVSGNRVRIVAPQVDGTRAAFIAPDHGSTDLFAQGTILTGSADGVLAVSITDSRNYISTARGNGVVNLVSRKDGVSTVVGSWPASGSVLRLEYLEGVATVKVGGVTVGSATISDPPPLTSRAGFIAVLGTNDFLDNFSSGAM